MAHLLECLVLGVIALQIVTCQTTNGPNACRSLNADVVVLLDSSGSIQSSEFTKMKNFTASIAQSFDIGGHRVHMSVVTFSSHPTQEFRLNTYHNKHGLLAAINKIHGHHSGATNTSSALHYLGNHVFTSHNGDRHGVPNVVILITGGRSSNPNLTIKEANQLHQHGVIIVAIGIGAGVDPQELNGIAKIQNLAFQAPSYDALHTIQGLLNHGICNGHHHHQQPIHATTSGCEDKLSNCHQYGLESCYLYTQWATDNCPQYCQKCTGQGTGSPLFG